MVLSNKISDLIVNISHEYLGRKFNLNSFNCVHFVREVYAKVGIILPLLNRYGIPPREFHLLEEEFAHMPIGHSVFFKRRTGHSTRSWTHMAIVFSEDTLVHCTRNLGEGVVLTPKSVFMETYILSPTKHCTE